MARIRTIKPTFFTSLTIADLTYTQRLTFIGLWTHVDDEGRCIYDPRLIKAALWPLDDRTADDIADDVRALTEHSLIVHYTVGERSYLQVRTWQEHQRINRKTKSTLPGPEKGQIVPLTSRNEPSLSTHGALTEDVHREGKGRERKGKDSATRGNLPEAVADAPGTQELIAEWIGHCTSRPPNRVIGQVSKELKALLNEGIPFDDVRNGLSEWHRKNLHPATIPSVIHETRNRNSSPVIATGTQRAQAALDIAKQLEAEEGEHAHAQIGNSKTAS